MGFEGLHGIKNLAFDVLALIASGEKETIKKIEEEIGKDSIINYLQEKYSDSIMIQLGKDCIYDLKAWNKNFSSYSGWVEGNESRKFGITNEDDGLLLLLGLIIDTLKDAE